MPGNNDIAGTGKESHLPCRPISGLSAQAPSPGRPTVSNPISIPEDGPSSNVSSPSVHTLGPVGTHTAFKAQPASGFFSEHSPADIHSRLLPQGMYYLFAYVPPGLTQNWISRSTLTKGRAACIDLPHAFGSQIPAQSRCPTVSAGLATGETAENRLRPQALTAAAPKPRGSVAGSGVSSTHGCKRSMTLTQSCLCNEISTKSPEPQCAGSF